MPIHVRIKLFLKNLLPHKLFTYINSLWRSYFAKFIKQDNDVNMYYEDYISKHDLVVSGGPFEGMKYISESAGSVLFNKLIGSYEEILHKPIDIIKTEKYDTIIDIGCAEGYYLAGLGRTLPNSHLIGYDIDSKALGLTEKLVTANRLTNKLSLDTTCTHQKLNEQISDNTLIICDAEGFELEILDPEKAPALKRVKKYLVETHDFAAPGIVETLQNRFSSTHNIEKIEFKMADSNNYPYLANITNKTHLYYLLRERGEQEQIWLVMSLK